MEADLSRKQRVEYSEGRTGYLIRFSDGHVLTKDAGKVHMVSAILNKHDVMVVDMPSGNLVVVPADKLIEINDGTRGDKTIILKTESGEISKDDAGFMVVGNPCEIAIDLAIQLEDMRERVLIADQADDSLRAEQVGK